MSVVADVRPALIEHLKDLHLPTVRECYEDTARRAERETLSYEQYLLEVITRECEQRRKSRDEPRRVDRHRRRSTRRRCATADERAHEAQGARGERGIGILPVDVEQVQPAGTLRFDRKRHVDSARPSAEMCSCILAATSLVALKRNADAKTHLDEAKRLDPNNAEIKNVKLP